MAISTKVVLGRPKAITTRLEALSTSRMVTTSVVERENLTLRQQSRRLTRKTSGFSKELPGLEKQLWPVLAYYHVVLPQDSLQQRLEVPEPTRRTGSVRGWRPITPAMAAGMTDQIWTRPNCCRSASRRNLWISCVLSNTCFHPWNNFIKVIEGHHLNARQPPYRQGPRQCYNLRDWSGSGAQPSLPQNYYRARTICENLSLPAHTSRLP